MFVEQLHDLENEYWAKIYPQVYRRDALTIHILPSRLEKRLWNILASNPNIDGCAIRYDTQTQLRDPSPVYSKMKKIFIILRKDRGSLAFSKEITTLNFILKAT